MSSTTCFTEAELHRCTTYMYSCFNIACILCVASHIVSSLLTHSPFLHSSLNMHITMCILIMRNVWAIVLCSLLFCRFCDYFIPHCRGSIWSVSTVSRRLRASRRYDMLLCVCGAVMHSSLSNITRFSCAEGPLRMPRKTCVLLGPLVLISLLHKLTESGR